MLKIIQEHNDNSNKIQNLGEIRRLYYLAF